MEATRLRQKAEELVKDNELLPPPSPSLGSFDPLAELTGIRGVWVPLTLPETKLPKSFTVNSLLMPKPTSPGLSLGHRLPFHSCLAATYPQKVRFGRDFKTILLKIASDSALLRPQQT